MNLAEFVREGRIDPDLVAGVSAPIRCDLPTVLMPKPYLEGREAEVMAALNGGAGSAHQIAGITGFSYESVRGCLRRLADRNLATVEDAASFSGRFARKVWRPA